MAKHAENEKRIQIKPMRVVLLQPPIEDFYDTEVRHQPLGLCLLKAAVRKHLPGVDVKVIDFHHGHGRRTIPVPEELSYLSDYYDSPDSSPFCSFHNYFRFGADPKSAAGKVADCKPDLVGISCLFSPYFKEALACACEIKSLLDVPVVMGGGHASACPESLLADPSVDYVIRGEGERPLVELVRAMKNGMGPETVPNLGFKKDGALKFNAKGDPYPLDEIPWAELSDLKNESYLYEKRPMCMVMTSRGCPNRCAFCSVHSVFGWKYRTRRPEDVFREMRHRFDEGYRVFDFEDDNLAYKRDNFLKLLNMIGKGFAPVEVRLLAMNGISYDTLDREVLEAMWGAGFRSINISLVSGNQNILSDLDRPHSTARFSDVVSWARYLGFMITAYQIIGLPNEDLESICETMGLLARMPLLLGPSIYYPAPGSRLASEVRGMTEADFIRARSTAMAGAESRAERDCLYTLFVTARIINFLKGTPGLVPGDRLGFDDALGCLGRKGVREGKGAEILRILLSERRLHAATRMGLIPLERFNYSVFEKVMMKAGRIGAVTGGEISLPDGLTVL